MKRRQRGGPRPEAVERVLTRLAVCCMTLLVTVQFLLADEGTRARLNFLDYAEGIPLTTVEALRPGVGGGLARLEPVLPGDGQGWLVLEGGPEPGLAVLVNGRRVGDLSRGTLVVIVRSGDLLELDATGLDRVLPVSVRAVSRRVLSPVAGTRVNAPARRVSLVGRIAAADR